jgi:hypothetical protein
VASTTADDHGVKFLINIPGSLTCFQQEIWVYHSNYMLDDEVLCSLVHINR